MGGVCPNPHGAHGVIHDEYELERHARKQGVSYEDAERYFERMGSTYVNELSPRAEEFPVQECTCGHKPEFCHRINAGRWCGGQPRAVKIAEEGTIWPEAIFALARALKDATPLSHGREREARVSDAAALMGELEKNGWLIVEDPRKPAHISGGGDNV